MLLVSSPWSCSSYFVALCLLGSGDKFVKKLPPKEENVAEMNIETAKKIIEDDNGTFIVPKDWDIHFGFEMYRCGKPICACLYIDKDSDL